MTSDPEASLFEFAASNRTPTTEEEQTVTDIHAALGINAVPLRLRRPPVAPRSARGKSNFRQYLFAMAAVLLAFTIATGSFIALQPERGGTPTEVPTVVLGLISQADATPAASACEFSGDVPLFVGTESSPIDETSVIVTLEQDLKVTCGDSETTLAQNVKAATPTQTPYVVLLITEAGPKLLNVSTGESLNIDHDFSETQQVIGMQTWEDWAILPSTAEPDGMSLYLLDSFTEIPVELNGEAIDQESITGMTVSAESDVFTLAITEEGEADSRALTGLFVANTDGSSHSVQPPAIVNPDQMVISPDGETIAIVSYEGSRTNGSKKLTLVSAADGTVINEIEIDDRPGFIDLNWLNDGSALLYTSSTGLYKLTDPTSEPELVLEGTEVNGLALTHDDQVISVSSRVPSDSGQFDSMTTIINLETGDETEVDGRDLFSGSSMATKRSTLLLVNPAVQTTSDPVTVTAVDAITGESLGEFQHTLPENGYFHTSWGFDRDINIVGFLPDSIYRLTDDEGNPAMIQVPEPPVESEGDPGALLLTISPDGIITLRMYDPNTAWILMPGDEDWTEVNLADPSESRGVNVSMGIILGDD